MCGLAGFAGEGSRADLTRMTRALQHRGPDGEGFFVDPETGTHLGHRRLAILDIDGGRQPMWNEDDSVCIVFNGEIYNHRELRNELQRAGHRFVSDHSDTEVLVHGYEEWGHDLPERLNGMFAFALLDIPRRRLFLARDRFGEKPLYYSHSKHLFAFASELGALASHDSVSRSIDQRSLAKLLAWGYLPAPHAILDGCKKLPGGHWLEYDIAAGTVRTQAYWRFELQISAGITDRDEDRLVDELGHLLAQAARRRLMSDVPLGVYLSGGLDSSLVLGSVVEGGSAGPIGTFTIGFTEATFDEREPARLVARHFGSRHHEQVLDLAEAGKLIPEILTRLDEPFADASILPTSLLADFARRHVKVALTGDGGDELFAGYDPFLALRPASLYTRLVPRPIHACLRWSAELIPSSESNMSLDFKLKRLLLGLTYDEPARLPVWMCPLEPSEVSRIMGKPLSLEDLYGEAVDLWQRDPRLSVTDRALEFFTTFYLQDDILVKADRAAMMHSLECRAVFLDNDVVEFCRRLPASFKLRGGKRKYLLKKLALRMLPRSIVERPKKGFGIPLAAWLKSIPSVPPLDPVAGLDVAYARNAWNEHRSGGRDHRLFLWTWLGLQHFQRRVLACPPYAAT
jgi:asparagine synthase (glutamine-hydrolysing)